MSAVSVFIAYSHRDEALREELLKQLAVLERRGAIEIWYDRKISPGSDWDAEIAAKLESARVILLLVSSEFLASDYCSNREMKRAFERHAAKEACVVPVILRPALWTETELKTLQALPKDGRPVTTWENRDEAWLDVAAGINRLVGRFAPAVAPPPPAPPLDPTTASRITSETVETAAQGLGALANLMSETHVRRAVIEFQTQFAASRKQFRLLADYKAIHDILHHLQLGCYNRIKKAARGFPDNAGDTDELVSQQMELEETLNQFKKLCESGSSVADRAGRILETITQGYTLLGEALNDADKRKMGLCLRKLDPLISQEPARINAGLYAAAEGLRLADLTSAMRVICDKMSEMRVDPEKVRRITEGLIALVKLGSDLAALAREHDRWQNADDVLRRIEAADPILDELEASSAEIEDQIAPLYMGRSDDWARRIQEEWQKLEAALRARDTPKLTASFRQYRNRTVRRFFDVDAGLKEQCLMFTRVGEPLDSILMMMTV